MAQIMTMKEFGQKYSSSLSREKTSQIIRMKPGESMTITSRAEDIVLVRVTKYHMATMYAYEFYGIE